MTSWYSGAPDECSHCYWAGEIVKVSDCRNPDHGHVAPDTVYYDRMDEAIWGERPKPCPNPEDHSECCANNNGAEHRWVSRGR